MQMFHNSLNCYIATKLSIKSYSGLKRKINKVSLFEILRINDFLFDSEIVTKIFHGIITLNKIYLYCNNQMMWSFVI